MTRHLLIAAAFASTTALQDPAIVNTNLGPVAGIVGSNYRLFEGVPYAQPPVGPLRWRESQPVQPWAPNTYSATKEAAGCMQVCYDDEPPHICPAHVSEDCLYMNIFTPLPSDARLQSGPAPVIVFFHGGNFHDGYAGGFDADGGLLYDGRAFVQNTGQIIVVVNYRLGAFGFLYLEDNGANSTHGNFGLQDQVLALQWVKANIAPFGGDPSRITVMGQSAGAMSISCHLTRPVNEGLFQGAIMQSNPYAESYRGKTSALELASIFSNYSGCGLLPLNPSQGDLDKVEACLRTMDSATLLNAQHESETNLIPDLTALLQIVVAWGPTIGTEYLPLRPLEAFQQGQVLDVPILVGTTKDEAVIFVYEALTTPLSLLAYQIVGNVLFGPQLFNESQAPSLYPLPNPPPADGDYRIFASSPFTDGLFICPTRNATEALAVAQPGRVSKTYVWQYSHQMSWSPVMWGSNFTECWNKVCHGSDLPEWWSPEEAALGANFTQQELDLAQDMQTYFANFAATGNPGSGSAARPLSWPAYSVATGRQVLDFEAEPTGKSIIPGGLRQQWCDWWDAVAGWHIW